MRGFGSRRRNAAIALALLVCVSGLLVAAPVVHDGTHTHSDLQCLACRLALSAVPALAVALALCLTLQPLGWIAAEQQAALPSRSPGGHGPRGPPLH